MENTKTNNTERVKTTIKALSMHQHVTPLPVERTKNGLSGTDTYVMYGDRNLYPNFLLSLYNNSPIHKGITDSKVDYILGKGIYKEGTDEKMEFLVNDVDTIEDFTNKITKDFELFNYYAVLVTYNADGLAFRYDHIPAHKIRANSNKTKFWLSEDWYDASPSLLTFDAWRRDTEGNYESKIYFYSAYTPSVYNTYPVPGYSGGIKAIETDIAIRDFHINNINNNFSASSIITFFNGEPPVEIKEDLQNKITESYTGTKGGKIIINYANEDSKAAEVSNISPTEWNNAYESLKRDTKEDIVIAHRVTSALLVGIKTEGQLGGASELETAYQIFRSQYIVRKRSEIIQSLNALFEGVYDKLYIADSEKLFPEELDSSVKIQIMTINELREIQGLSPLANGLGDRLISESPTQKATETDSYKFSKEDLDEIDFSKVEDFGLDKNDFNIIKRCSLSENDIKFKLNFNKESVLTNYFLKNKLTGKTLRKIQKELNDDSLDQFTIQEIRNELARLVTARLIPNTTLIDRDDLQKAIKNLSFDPSSNKNFDKSNMNRVELRYAYEGVSDNKNRPFCHQLVRNNKLYTREEIQLMSSILGYDVYKFSGGKNCRGHKWVPYSVVKK